MFSSSSTMQAEAHLCGDNSRAVIAGNLIEIKAGQVSVNGVSYGPVAPGSPVRYVVRPGEALLYVDGQVRGPAA